MATFAELTEEQHPLITSNLVVAETHALALSRAGREIALHFVEAVTAHVVYDIATDRDYVMRILNRYQDKAFSYTDAFSFAIMDRLGISVAFAFDDDFRQYGLDVIP